VFLCLAVRGTAVRAAAKNVGNSPPVSFAANPGVAGTARAIFHCMVRHQIKGLAAFCLAAPLLALGCAGGASGDGAGGQMPSAEAGPGDPDGGGMVDDGCASSARWVYLLSRPPAGSPAGTPSNLVRFEPDSKTFTVIGPVQCAVAEGASTFSMAVDRSGTAWVLYGDGSIFRVSTVDASCEATAWPVGGMDGYRHFGMGFSTEGADSTEERLFVGGAPDPAEAILYSRLGVIDTETMTVSRLPNRFQSWLPELTGNSLGELWGFRPAYTFSQIAVPGVDGPHPAAIMRFNKADGTIAQKFELDELDDFSAFAFAYWGGSYFVFLVENVVGGTTNVWRFDPATEELTAYVTDSGYYVVGAGVSTCAPTVIL
jgi:hypothetical protein